MENFLEAYNKTMSHEGGYVNDPDDAGGETYKGVSRKYNPSWSGWLVIDSLKDSPDFPKCLDDNEMLQGDVLYFYKKKYFDPYSGDEMPYGLALEMFDTAVNMGTGRAVRFLQYSLNLLNRNGKLYKDMEMDGDYGKTTHGCLQTYLKNDTVQLLLKFLNVMQGYHYIDYMNNPRSKKNMRRGWFNRVEISKR